MDNTEPLVEQAMTADDAAAALPLSLEAGWNQTVDDWRFMLASGQAVGLQDPSGRWVGSSLALPYGTALSWISMVLVAKPYRRHGIGTRLLRRCIDAVRARGAVAGLDATELGRPVYLPLGFRDLYPISRWCLNGDGVEPAPPDCATRPIRPEDLPALVAFDAPRTGMARAYVLRYLSQHAPHQAFVAEDAGRTTGYALGRPGRVTPQIGPIVAEDEATATALTRRALAAVAGPTIIDVPDAHGGLSRWLKQHGAVRQRGYVRMVLGEPATGIEDPRRIFALAGPELG